MMSLLEMLAPRFLVADSLKIPADLSSYRVVIVARYEAANPTTWNYLVSYLRSGGGVVLLFGTPRFLCGWNY